MRPEEIPPAAIAVMGEMPVVVQVGKTQRRRTGGETPRERPEDFRCQRRLYLLAQPCLGLVVLLLLDLSCLLRLLLVILAFGHYRLVEQGLNCRHRTVIVVIRGHRSVLFSLSF